MMNWSHGEISSKEIVKRLDLRPVRETSHEKVLSQIFSTIIHSLVPINDTSIISSCAKEERGRKKKNPRKNSLKNISI